MLVLIVLVFVAVDVIILLAYFIYNGVQGNLDAVRLRNKEHPRAELGVSWKPRIDVIGPILGLSQILDFSVAPVDMK